MEVCSCTSHEEALSSTVQIELGFRSADFRGGGKTGEPGEKPFEQGKLNHYPLMTLGIQD